MPFQIENFSALPHSDPMYRLLAVLLVLCGCEQSPPKSTPVQSTNRSLLFSDTPGHLDHAQPRLRTMKLWLGPKEITAELAINDVERNTGMMFRDKMEENEGMLFIFPQPALVSFYMRNTYVPLSCAYIGPDGTILEIHDLKPLDETPVYAKSDQIQYVLEVKQGWFERNGVRVGTVVRTEHGSFPETFFRRGNDKL